MRIRLAEMVESEERIVREGIKRSLKSRGTYDRAFINFCTCCSLQKMQFAIWWLDKNYDKYDSMYIVRILYLTSVIHIILIVCAILLILFTITIINILGESSEIELASMERDHRQRMRELAGDEISESESLRAEFVQQVRSCDAQNFTHTLSLFLSLFLPLTDPLTLSHTYIYTHTQTLSRTHALSLFHIHTLSPSLSHTYTLPLSLSQVENERERTESDLIRVQNEWRVKLREAEKSNTYELSVLQKDHTEQVN